ncbi:MAG TPA: SRPBCC family protein [Actinomycetota bacterium]|nr:SRPBCC family protein [Actinomycetota bacterium]
MAIRAQEDVIEFERRIAARPETVFSYFTDPERYRRWQGVDAELDPRPGGVFRITLTGKTRTVARGSYVEVDPPRRVVFTWGWEAVERYPADFLPEGIQGVGPGSSTVEVVLTPQDGGTLLRIRHSGLETLVQREFHTSGWELSLDRLAAATRGEDPGPYPLADL